MHEKYMQRCLDLAWNGFRNTGKNPMVGAVLVYNDSIIGEGYHEYFGGPHAEVNCIQSVAENNRHLLPKSTLYVSLEPCNHYGKTPPCTDLIIENNIPHVVYASIDRNEKVKGKTKEILESNGIKTTIGVLSEEAEYLLQKFNRNHIDNRPFITLKWAQSINGFAGKEHKSVWYSNQYSKVFAHKLRADHEMILIGPNTALVDNPQLTNRLSYGKQPIIGIFDRNQRIPRTHQLLQSPDNILFISEKNQVKYNCKAILVKNENFIENAIKLAYNNENITSLLVEGGPSLQKVFIHENLWNQAYVIKTKSSDNEGIKAPQVNGKLINKINLASDYVYQISNEKLVYQKPY